MSADTGVEIDCDFPGGNIIVDAIEGDSVSLRQDPRDTEGPWFWWYMRVRGAAGRGGRTLDFSFTDGEVIGVRGPAASCDGGRTWRWLWELREGRADAFRYEFSGGEGGENDVRFAFAVPYVEADLHEWLARHDGDPGLRIEEHCRSRAGRSVERLLVSSPDRSGEPVHRVLFTSRHHACESAATYVMEGLLEEALSDSGPGEWLRANCEIAAVPFVDKDGVEQGDQGKNRRPHDHNRDYVGESVHPEVAAMRAWAPEWSRGRLHVTMDLHCPHISGEWNERVYFVGGQNADLWASTLEFAKLLEGVNDSPVPYDAALNLPFGTAWNKPSARGKGMSFGGWARTELPDVRLATSMEFPYANLAGVETTPQRARAFGGVLARTLARFLERSQG